MRCVFVCYTLTYIFLSKGCYPYVGTCICCPNDEKGMLSAVEIISSIAFLFAFLVFHIIFFFFCFLILLVLQYVCSSFFQSRFCDILLLLAWQLFVFCRGETELLRHIQKIMKMRNRRVEKDFDISAEYFYK